MATEKTKTFEQYFLESSIDLLPEEDRQIARYTQAVHTMTPSKLVKKHADFVKAVNLRLKQVFAKFKTSTNAKLLEHRRFEYDGQMAIVLQKYFKVPPSQVVFPKIKWYVGEVDFDTRRTVDGHGYVYFVDPGTIYLDAALLETDLKDDMMLTAIHELAHSIQFQIKDYRNNPTDGHDMLWKAVCVSLGFTPEQFADVGINRD